MSPKTDLTRWGVHGPVRALRTEFAEWDLGKEEWQQPRSFTLISFLSDGRLSEVETHNPDGSIVQTRYSYEGDGRLTKIQFLTNGTQTYEAFHHYDDSGRLLRIVNVGPDGTEHEFESYRYDGDGGKTKVYNVPKLEPNVGFSYSIEGTDRSYSADGAIKVVSLYDANDQPSEVGFYDADQHRLRRVNFHRDSMGRILKEDLLLEEETRFGEELPTTLAALFGPERALCSTSFSYDEAGRLLERTTQMGELGGDRTIFSYDDHGNPIEQIIEHTSREIQVDDSGNLQITKETSHSQTLRFEYIYDSQDNWTERIVWGRLHPNPNFQRSNTERREITYY